MTSTQTAADTVARFLTLPCEALPSADWVDAVDIELGDAWKYLHNPESLPVSARVRLWADRPEWRDGVIITLG